MRTKVAQPETTLAKHPAPAAPTPTGTTIPAMPGAAPTEPQPMSISMDKMKARAPMPTMGASLAPAPPMTGMSTATAPSDGMMGMMGMMDKMKPRGGASAPATDTSMPAAMPPGGMGMMEMDKMKMVRMMGKAPMVGAALDTIPQSSLPGFPGASHLYHLGATGFFLDDLQKTALTIEQQAALNKIKEQSALAKTTADRAIQQAEQERWTLTAADQPDATKIEARLREIEKLRADERLAFIRAVDDASKILTDDQRKILTGFAPVVPAVAPPAPMPAGMKGR